jgi:hypothetical protein
MRRDAAREVGMPDVFMSVITRRDYLISLGLVQRRKKKGAVEDLDTGDTEDVDELVTEETPPVLPAPVSAGPTEIPPS